MKKASREGLRLRPQRSKLLHQISAGGVVFKKTNSSVQFCLIGRRKNGTIVWCLPKGHVERGEELSEAAVREIREETGLAGPILSPLTSIRYKFFDLESRKLISKTVYFFLVRYAEGKTSDHDDEVECVRWFAIPEALKCVEYPGERRVLEKAVKKLKLLI